MVNWASLSHAYGSAEDVPDVLRSLVSDDADVREEALSELYGNIWHQGTVYEATAPAVPFLIGLFEHSGEVGSTVDRVGILALLEVIADGHSYHDVHGPITRSRSDRDNPEHLDTVQQELGWVWAAQDAVLNGMSVYLELLRHPEPSVRLGAARLIGMLGQYARLDDRVASSEAALTARLETENDPVARASLVRALGRFWQGSEHPEHRAFLMNLLESSTEPDLVRFTAAVVVLRLTHSGESARAVRVVLETVEAALDQYTEIDPQAESPTDALRDALQDNPNELTNLLLELLRHTNAEVRKDAIWSMENLCLERRSIPERVAPALVDCLKDPNVDIRKQAASTFGDLGSAARHAIPALMHALQDENPFVRSFSAVTLGKLRVTQAMPRIAELLEHSETALWAVDAIRKAGTAATNVLEVLRHALARTEQNDANEWAKGLPSVYGLDQYRIRLILALGSLGPAAVAAVPELRGYLRNPSTLLAAADTLGGLGELAQDAIPDLMEHLTINSPEVCWAAARALGRIGPRAVQSVPILKRCLMLEDKHARAEVALALYRIEGHAETVLAALQSTLEPDGDGRYDLSAISSTVEALGMMGFTAQAAVPKLLEHAQNELAWVGVPAARAIWRITRDAKLLLPLLVQALEARNGGSKVMDCLEEMGEAAREALPLLKRAAEGDARWIAAGGLGEIIDQDERFQARALQLIERLESSL